MRRLELIATSRARCPHCDREIEWRGHPHRPFCSLSCRLIDLGVWLDERYRVPGPRFPVGSIVDDGYPPDGE